ncbi:MAG: LLM class flavin-dependent oxidoreductase [Acidimicrobiia bacterium]
MKLGLTLPSFVDDPDVPIAVAQAADAHGVDGVFAYDHLFRYSRTGEKRPALECFVLLGAVAAETERVKLGSLVARATLRPAAVLTNSFDSVQRVSGGRLIAGIGAGDTESRDEMVTFGYEFGSVETRLVELESAVVSAQGRGYPVWVGGHARLVGDIAAEHADGWNHWGGTPAQFAQDLASLHAKVIDNDWEPERFVATWGGLVLLGESEADAEQKRQRIDPAPDVVVGGPERVAEALRAFGEAGAQWCVCGPADPTNPDNAAILGEVIAPLVRD